MTADVAIRVKGDGSPIVLLHGIPGSAESWRHVGSELEPRHRVVVPDLLGFGESPRPRRFEDLAAPAQAEALARALDELRIERAVLVGHDFGGPVALHLLALRPRLARGLVLAATNAFPDARIPFPLTAVTWPVVGAPAARTLFSGPSLRLMLRTGAGSPRPRLDADAAVGDRAQRRSIRLLFANSLRRLEELYAPLERMLRELDVPVAVVWGDRDPFFSLEHGRRTAAAIPGGRFILLEGAGHFLTEERPRELAAEIESLAEETESRSPAAA